MSESASRRQFMIGAACVACSAFASGCGTETPEDSSLPKDPSAAPTEYPDGMRASKDVPDVASAQCPSTGPFVVGPAADSLALNQAVRVNGNLWVGRDSTGLFAVNLVCTHFGGPLLLDQGSLTWICQTHASRFSMRGDLLQGPATLPLPRFLVCKDASGRLVIDTSKRI